MFYLRRIIALNIYCFSILIKLFGLTTETEKLCLKGTYFLGRSKEGEELFILDANGVLSL